MSWLSKISGTLFSFHPLKDIFLSVYVLRSIAKMERIFTKEKEGISEVKVFKGD